MPSNEQGPIVKPGLVQRYLSNDTTGSSGPTFGKPFRYGTPISFNRQRVPNDSLGPTWSSLLYLDPATPYLTMPLSGTRLPTTTRPQIVKASIVSHRGNADQEQVPPPAAITITKVQARGVSGVDVRPKVTGVAVREPTTTTSTHGSRLNTSTNPVSASAFPVYERLDKHEATRRVGGPLGLLALAHQRVHGSSSNLTTLQKVVEAWAEEKRLADAGPGPGDYDPSGSSTLPKSSTANTLGGPAFTMGARTRGAMPGTSLVAPDAGSIPGPGHYNVLEAAKTGGPAYTMGGARVMPAPDLLPGPGQYQNTKTSFGNGPAFSMAGKPIESCEELPGPGEYDIPRDVAHGAAFTIAGRTSSPAPERLPGPADYQQLQPAGKGAPAFTLYSRVAGVKPEALPAPGEYDLPAAWNTGPACTMASRPADKLPRDLSPGPGEYELATRTSLDGPAYTMARRPAEPTDLGSPGPGEYHTELPSKAPAFSIGVRHEEPAEPEASLLPGPGQYNVLQHPKPGSPAPPAYSMAGRPAEQVDDEQPGPGTYDVARGTLGGPAFTIATRTAPADGPDPDLPGPGQYDVLDSLKHPGPAFTMGQRPRELCVAPDSPAPGDYEVSSPRATGPAFTIPQAGTRPAPGSPASPGPGEYSPRDSLPNGPAYTIPGAGRVEPARPDSPAPGDYDVMLSTLDGPAFTILGKPASSPAKDPVPGPGEYFKPLERQGPAFTIATKPKEAQLVIDLVGPGAYDPVDPSSPSAPAYTMASKPRDAQEDLGPGPGQYEVPGSPKGPAYTMGTRPTAPGLDQAGPDSPGPAAYQVPLDSPRGPAYTMASRPADAGPNDDAPGPGEYSLPRASTGPAFSIQGRGTQAQPDLTPGPGEYFHPPASGAPAYTMAGRHQELTVLGDDVIIDPDIPGPGTYGAPGQNLIGNSGPAYTMGPRTKGTAWDGEPGTDGPGPAAYGAPGSPRGPAYSLGVRIDSGVMNSPGRDAPGPGHYGAPMPPGGGVAFTLGGKLPPPKSTATDAPAPGDYGSPADNGPHGPAFSLGGKRPEPDPALHQQGPGPGEHQRVLQPPTGPAFSLGARLKDLLGLKKNKKKASAADYAPEPGQYFTQMGPQGPAYTFGTKTSGPAPATSLVAPGDYDTGQDMKTGPAWTLRTRPADSIPELRPGPGAYDHTARPALSSILKTRPQGRTEYLVHKFTYPDARPVAAGGGRHRRVSFNSGTQFRDSTEQAQGVGQASSGAPLQQRGVPGVRPGDMNGAAAAARVDAASVKAKVAGQAQQKQHKHGNQGKPVADGKPRARAGGGRAGAAGSRAPSAPPGRPAPYITQPATNTYVYRPLPDTNRQDQHQHKASRQAPAHKAALQLAQPSAGYTVAPAQRLVAGTPPLVLSQMSGAAGKPAGGLIQRTPRQIATAPAVVSRTQAAMVAQAAPARPKRQAAPGAAQKHSTRQTGHAAGGAGVGSGAGQQLLLQQQYLALRGGPPAAQHSFEFPVL